MIPGVDLIDFIQAVSILGVAFVIFAVSGLLIGFFLPGDSLLFTTGFLISTGVVDFNIHLTVLILFLAAVAGDSVGYAFGRRAGPRVFNKPDARLFRQEYVQQAQAFYDKHGGKTVILARFVPIVRTFAPIVAGIAKMNYREFLAFNIIGALIWAAGITYAGFGLGRWFKHLGIEIDHIILPIVAGIIVVSILPPAIHILSDKKRRNSFINGVKTQFKLLFRKK